MPNRITRICKHITGVCSLMSISKGFYISEPVIVLVMGMFLVIALLLPVD